MWTIVLLIVILIFQLVCLGGLIFIWLWIIEDASVKLRDIAGGIYRISRDLSNISRVR